MIFGDGDGDEGVHQNLFVAKRLGDGGFEIRREEAFRLDEPLQHGEADHAIGADADGAAELGGIVDGDRDEVVRSHRLGGQIRALFGDGRGAVGLLLLLGQSGCRENYC